MNQKLSSPSYHSYFAPVEFEIEAKCEEDAFERVGAVLELSIGKSLLRPAEEVWGQG